MSNFDLLRINRIIKDIDRFLDDLANMNVNSVNDLENKEKFYAVSMVLFSIINRSIDLGEGIVDSLNIGLPENYRDIFYLLRRNNYISADLFNEMEALIRDRNLLSHEYYTFGEKDIFNILHRIEAVNSFVQRAKEIIKQEEEK